MVWVRRAHLVVAWAFAAGVVVQVFLAGLAVFESPARFATHTEWGYLLGMSAILLLILAAVGRLRRQVLYALALWGLFALQSLFIAVRDAQPVVAALHPVNGFLILLVGIAMAREAWRTRDRGTVAAPSPRPAEVSARG